MNDLRSNERSILACRTSANTKMRKTAFAGTLQAPRKYGWHLQDFCKHHGNTVGICRNAASATEIRLAFAGMLQTPRKYGWHLQNFCKRHGNTVGICRNAANIKMGEIVCDPFCMTVKRRERRMNALEINAELQHELSVIADDEGYLKRALKSIRRLADQKRKEDETYMTDEEFQAKINRSLEQARRGEVIELLPGESLDDMLRRAGYDDK